ncbi:hypothetical protein LOAG_14292 [Loa loa]|uniref:Uncharacterized protein n=1 Tax=Loa loa TaxID=7209 RepID=A0A1S0TJC4_LOALO|nr:hypothetical protein LOAG_14292 [Loa loa]EFO14232.1 hypothetical protein LOAG_14292 [Loa loa]
MILDEIIDRKSSTSIIRIDSAMVFSRDISAISVKIHFKRESSLLDTGITLCIILLNNENGKFSTAAFDIKNCRSSENLCHTGKQQSPILIDANRIEQENGTEKIFKLIGFNNDETIYFRTLNFYSTER